MQNSFVLHGDICYAAARDKLVTQRGGYLVCVDGLSQGVFAQCPEEFRHLPQYDYADQLIIPGLTDLHMHAPQFSFRSVGLDMELLDWLNTYTFPEESKYADLAYAKTAYGHFVHDILHGPNTRACLFGTLHVDATIELMDQLEQAGLVTMVGKVNMDRNGAPTLQEASAEASAQATRRWLEAIDGRYQYTKPILTPRFIPSCSDKLMGMLGEIQKQYRLPVQSHLSENLGEIAWVKELCPGTKHYGGAYDQFGLFGGADCPTIMAHCVWSSDDEIALMRERGVYMAHCAASNSNLASGIAPVRRFMNAGVSVGLGSDIAGGTHTSILRAMVDSIQASKLCWRLIDQDLQPLSVTEAFWLGSVGSGSFFGKVGSFVEGYECDAVVISDARYNHAGPENLATRLERTIYLSEDQDVQHKFVQGRMLF